MDKCQARLERAIYNKLTWRDRLIMEWDIFKSLINSFMITWKREGLMSAVRFFINATRKMRRTRNDQS